MDSCPKELEPFEIAHKNKIKEQDMLQHLWWKNYGISALYFAIEHCFSKHPNSKFIENPILHDMDKENGMSEEELQRQRELFVAKLQVMKTNFELSKK